MAYPSDFEFNDDLEAVRPRARPNQRTGHAWVRVEPHAIPSCERIRRHTRVYDERPVYIHLPEGDVFP